MKIYTKTGDKGVTSLYDGSRISKNNIVFDILGENDELNVRVGKLWCLVEEKLNDKELLEDIRNIQSSIEIINTNIATPSFLDIDGIMKKKKECLCIKEYMIKYLEIQIDKMEKSLPKLTNFILPCVTLVDSESHLCRTQARKCERMLCNLNENYILDNNIIIYINRLSDFFFVLSRYICYSMGKTDFFKSIVS